MTDINVITLVGRLVRDSEISYTAGGMAIAKLSLAVNRSRKGADGARVDEASFFDAEVYGKIAETMNPYLKKGKQVAIDGYLKQDRWEKDGKMNSRIKIGIENIQLLGSRGDGNGNAAPSQDYGNADDIAF